MPIAIDLPWARQKPGPIELPNVELPRVDLATRVDDTKRAVSDGADQIGAVAQDLSSQAATLGREALRVGREAARASRGAARRGQLLAATGGDTLRQLRADAAAAADDLRSIRIVREKRTGPDWKPGVALIAGVSAGAAAMFFLDPEQGRRRRTLFADQLRKWTRLSGEWLDGTARDLRNRSVGLAHEARKATESLRAETTDYDEQASVVSGPDVSTELGATDWQEPATADTYRSNA